MTRLRRLTRDQFNNTVRDLFGVTGDPASGIAQDERIGPFHSNAIAPITDLVVQQHQEVAASVAASARTRMNAITSQLVSCNLATDTGTTCAAQLVSALGLRAYRRPLATDEVQKYVGLFTLGKTGSGVENGFRLVVEGMLQSPFFLYHHDVGGQGMVATAPVAVTGYELASRLSFFL